MWINTGWLINWWYLSHFSETEWAAEWILTRTVVGVRSSSRCFSPSADPPIKVIIGVLSELAALLPLGFVHVETTSAWHAEDVLCEGERDERKEEFKVVLLLHNERDPLNRFRGKPISHFHSPQSISSDSSAQSALLSHTRWDSMQWPLRHTKSVTAGQLTGSTTSKTHTHRRKPQKRFEGHAIMKDLIFF